MISMGRFQRSKGKLGMPMWYKQDSSQNQQGSEVYLSNAFSACLDELKTSFVMALGIDFIL